MMRSFARLFYLLWVLTIVFRLSSAIKWQKKKLPSNTALEKYKLLFAQRQVGEKPVRFTLGIVLAEHKNLDLNQLLGVMGETRLPSFRKLMLGHHVQRTAEINRVSPTALRQVKLSLQTLSSSIHFHVNPVRIDGIGLNKIVKKLFCDAESDGTNTVLFIVDKHAAVKHNGVLLANFMTMISNYAGLPAMAWSNTPVIEIEEMTKVELPTILLTPSVRMQAKAIYFFLQNQLPDLKATIMISRRATGYEVFINEIRRLAGKTGSYNRNFFQGPNVDDKEHMSSRFIELTYSDDLSKQNLRDNLQVIRDHTDIRAFILYMEPSETEVILKQAHMLGMTTAEYFWICGRSAFVEAPEIPIHYPPGMLVATFNTSTAIQKIAIKAAVRIWMAAVRRLAPMVRTNNPLIPVISCTRFSAPKWKFGHIFHIMMKRQLKKILYSKKNLYGFAGMIEMHIVGLDITRNWLKIASWSPRQGLTVENQDWLMRFHKFGADQNIPKHFIQIVTLDEEPYVIYTMPDKNGNCGRIATPCQLAAIAKHDTDAHAHVLDEDKIEKFHRGNLTDICCQGFVVDLIRRLSEDIGFRFKIFEVADRKWGGFDQNTRKWNGLIRALLDDQADVVGTSLKINTARASAIDFTIPFYQTGITILVNVQEGMVSSVAYLEPLSPATWVIVFFGCVNLAAFCIFWFEKLNRSADNEIRKIRGEEVISFENRRYIFESYWIVLSIFFNATMKADAPKSLSGRFILNVWALFCLIFLSSFMANLAAFMISKEEYHDFSGIDDIRFSNPYSKSPPWRFGTIPHGATEHIIMTNFPEMHQYMRPFMRNDVDDGVQSILNGELDAFIYDASVLTYKAGRDSECRLKTVGKWYAPTGYGFGMPKSSKWVHKFNKFILRYQASGYLQHLEDFWLSSSCNALHKKDTHKSQELSIIHMSSLYSILLIGIAICGFLVYGHRLYINRKSMRLADENKPKPIRKIPSYSKFIMKFKQKKNDKEK